MKAGNGRGQRTCTGEAGQLPGPSRSVTQDTLCSPASDCRRAAEHRPREAVGTSTWGFYGEQVSHAPSAWLMQTCGLPRRKQALGTNGVIGANSLSIKSPLVSQGMALGRSPPALYC